MQVVRFVDLNPEAITALQTALQAQHLPRRLTFLGPPNNCTAAMQHIQQRLEVCSKTTPTPSTVLPVMPDLKTRPCQDARPIIMCFSISHLTSL